MVVFLEPFYNDLAHAPVNAGLIETALADGQHQQIRIAADTRHLAALAAIIDPKVWKQATRIPLPLPAIGAGFMACLALNYPNLTLAAKGCTGG